MFEGEPWGTPQPYAAPAGPQLLAAAFAATLALGGCGGIEFQGKVFDYMGLSGDRQEADPRMAERPPLLLPPDTKALPPPGSGVAVATAREDWPQNPEAGAEADRQGSRRPRRPRKKPRTIPSILMPASRPFSTNGFGRKKEPEQVDDVPEPDPADKPPADQAVAAAKPKPLTPHVPQEITPDGEDLFHPAPPESYKNPSALY